jgi:hypothetical protein
MSQEPSSFGGVGVQTIPKEQEEEFSKESTKKIFALLSLDEY